MASVTRPRWPEGCTLGVDVRPAFGFALLAARDGHTTTSEIADVTGTTKQAASKLTATKSIYEEFEGAIADRIGVQELDRVRGGLTRLVMSANEGGDLINSAAAASRGQTSTCAVIMIDTSRSGRSTPSFVTARAGGSAANTFSYSSFIPAKSAGSASSTVT